MKKYIFKSKIELLLIILTGCLIILLTPVLLFHDTQHLGLSICICLGFMMSTFFYTKSILNVKNIFVSRFSKRHSVFFNDQGSFKFSDQGFMIDNHSVNWSAIRQLKIVAINPQSKFYQYLRINLFTDSGNFSFNIHTPGIYQFYHQLMKAFPHLDPKIEVSICGSTRHAFNYLAIK